MVEVLGGPPNELPEVFQEIAEDVFDAMLSNPHDFLTEVDDRMSAENNSDLLELIKFGVVRYGDSYGTAARYTYFCLSEQYRRGGNKIPKIGELAVRRLRDEQEAANPEQFMAENTSVLLAISFRNEHLHNGIIRLVQDEPLGGEELQGKIFAVNLGSIAVYKLISNTPTP